MNPKKYGSQGISIFEVGRNVVLLLHFTFRRSSCIFGSVC
jgi:hypothetical protein